MVAIWLTYAWDDNKTGDVDYIARQLEEVGLDVRLDRRDLKAGLDLWKQIQHFITDGDLCDAWILYATQNSLGSEACKKEYVYALDRALESLGEDFPIIVLFPSSIDRNLLSPAIRSRVYVSTKDPDWKERIKAAAEHRNPAIARQNLLPYELRIHDAVGHSMGRYAIEVRPRAGTWAPFLAGIPITEKDAVLPDFQIGPSGRVPDPGTMFDIKIGPGGGGTWWILKSDMEATPTRSYFIFCQRLPSELLFGIAGSSSATQYKVGF